MSTPPTTHTLDLGPLLQRIDALSAQVAQLNERQRRQEELFEEMTPIARSALSVAIERLDIFEKKGYFAFGEALLGVAERVMEGFSADDVRQLGEAAVNILDAVRSLTQPEVLAIAADATQVMQSAEDVKPLGIFGMVKASQNDDVQKGMALMVEVLRRVGRGANALTSRQQQQQDRKSKLAEMLGPRRKQLGVERPKPPPIPTRRAAPPPHPASHPAQPHAIHAPPAAASPGCAVPARPTASAAVIDGIAYSADGHLIDHTAWTRPLADAIAHLQGVTLTEAHWAIIDTARADFIATSTSPNIRRLTQIAGVSTRDLYTLFPKAPARTIAKVAGLPKPAGCL
jgi:TusE/DsrC/DsvC family sulfur relay protein